MIKCWVLLITLLFLHHLIVIIRHILSRVTIQHHRVMNASILVSLHNINITVFTTMTMHVQPVHLCVKVATILHNVRTVLMDTHSLIMVHVYSTVHITLPLLFMFHYFVAVKLLVVIRVQNMDINV